jgi:hypothetical protein
MGFFSSIGSAIGSVCSSVGSAIGSACSAIGSAISSFATGVGTVVGSIISALTPVAAALGKFANTFLQALGILKPNEDIQEMGDRALQAADKGITIDKFEKFDEYMAALRDFKLDPEQSAKRNSAAKMVAGLGVGTIATEEKFNLDRGSLNGMWLLPMANPGYFTPERMQTLVSTGRLGGDIFSYLEKRLSAGDTRTLEKRLEINPDGSAMSETELDTHYDEMHAARDNFADLGKQAEAKHSQAQGV